MTENEILLSLNNSFKKQFEGYEYRSFTNESNELDFLTKYSRCYNFEDYPTGMISLDPTKKNKLCYCSHRLKNITKRKAKTEILNAQVLQFDIDFKTKKAFEQFVTDCNVDQYSFILALRQDPFIWFGGLSASYAIRFYVPVFHSIYTNKHQNDHTIARNEDVFKSMYNEVLQYLNEQYGLTAYESEDKEQQSTYNEQQYVDLSSRDNITQASFQLWDDEYFFDNSNSVNVFWCKNEITYIEPKRITTTPSDSTNFEDSCDYEKLNKYLDRNDYNIKEKLKPHFLHFDNFPLKCTMLLEGENCQRFAYNCFNQFYSGDSLKPYLVSFEYFQKKLQAVRKYADFSPRTFASTLLNWGIKTPAQKKFIQRTQELNKDSYGNTFDKIFNITTNIFDEISDELWKVILEKIKTHKAIVINGDTGSGKNYYFSRMVLKNIIQNKNNHIFSPVNSILCQLKEDKIYGDEFVRGFTTDDLPSNYNAGYGECAVLSSYQHTKQELYPINIAVYDECHKMVHYSTLPNQSKPFAVVPADITIMMSATPEDYLVGLDRSEYYYIKIRKALALKPSMEYHYCSKQLDTMLKHVDPAKRQLFFINDKAKAQLFADNMKKLYNINSVLLTSNEKNTPQYREVMRYSILTDTHYIVTELVNDGVNFLNESWDDVFVYDNSFITYLTVYQLISRFRRVKNNINLVIFTRKRKIKYLKYADFMEKYGRLNDNYVEQLNQWTLICDSINKKKSTFTDKISLEKLYVVNGKYYVNADIIKKEVVGEFHKQLNIHSYILLNYYYDQFFSVKDSVYDNDINIEMSPETHNITEYEVFFKENIDRIISCYLFSCDKSCNEHFDNTFYDNIYCGSKNKVRNKYLILWSIRFTDLLSRDIGLNREDVLSLIFKRDRDYKTAVRSVELKYMSSTNELGNLSLLLRDIVVNMEQKVSELTGYTIKNIKYVEYKLVIDSLLTDTSFTSKHLLTDRLYVKQLIKSSGSLKCESRNINNSYKKYIYRINK